MIGVVKFYNANRGFGFVRVEHGTDEYFCHFKSVTDGSAELAEGQRVLFDVVNDPKTGKLRAINVSVIGR